MPGEPCNGPCNSHYRKTRALYEKAVADHADKIAKLEPGEEAPEPPQPPEVTPWPGEPVWCLKCQALIHRELHEIDLLAALVATGDPRTRSLDEEGAVKIRHAPGPGSPSSAMDCLEELDEWLRSWEAVARKEGDTPPRHGFLAKEVTEIVAWLRFHFDRIMLDTDIASDFGKETRRWHRELASFAAAGQANKHRKKPCPRCRLYTLWWTIGANYVRCVNEDCGRMLTISEYEAIGNAA